MNTLIGREGNRPLLAQKNSTRAGFTLVEVLLTLLVAGLLVLIALFLYQRSARRFVLQDEAIALATRLEQAKTLAQSQNREYRIVFNTNGYTPAVNTPATSTWNPAIAISEQEILLNPRVVYGFSGTINTSPTDQPCTSPPCPPLASAQIRFNSRGFPVDTPSDATPTAPRADNAVYLTDGLESFAVTVNILGYVRVWVFDRTINQWVAISR
ncbi:MAG: prepilin-type N-terminal cleavage/methylation domain-containing protein [Acidobacteriota bacterium]